VIGFIAFGLVVGVLARLFAPGRRHLGLGLTLLLGLVGSIVGGTVASWLGTGDVFELDLIGSIVAIASATFLVIAVDRATGDRRR
jgi:uncharacterized membrane protein YeaQ/YmgE (transglycosylase-associated protein family)